MEADGTADWGILPVFLRKIEEGFDVAVASYYAKGGRVEGTVWYRKALSRAGNIFTRTFLPIKGIHTYSSFYRIYRPAALRGVLEHFGDFYVESGFSCVVELLHRIYKLGFRVTEVPMVLQGGRRVGKSKMKVMQTVRGYLRIAARSAIRKS
jgi:dolichol-phosphate mannosyltransferase